MNLPKLYATHGLLVEEKRWFTLVELSRACHADMAMVVALVEEGVVTPSGDVGGGEPPGWRFDGDALRRARTALRLLRDLELSLSGVALALDLLDEIDRLRARIR